MVNFKEDARKNLLYFVRRKFSEWMFEFGVFVFILVLPAVIPSGGVQLTGSLWRIKHWDQNRTDALPELLNESLITLLMTLSKCWRCFLWRKVSLTPHTVSLETWEWERVMVWNVVSLLLLTLSRIESLQTKMKKMRLPRNKLKQLMALRTSSIVS